MIGAFGAHALRATLAATGRTETFETAVRYHFYHALALLLIGLLLDKFPVKTLEYAGLSILLGTLIFSGSLYILSLSGVRWLGAVAPIGGTLMIIGWVLLLVSVSRS